jgi:predicted transcriptional regulator
MKKRMSPEARMLELCYVLNVAWGGVTAGQIAAIIGISRRRVSALLNDMWRLGLVTRRVEWHRDNAEKHLYTLASPGKQFLVTGEIPPRLPGL